MKAGHALASCKAIQGQVGGAPACGDHSAQANSRALLPGLSPDACIALLAGCSALLRSAPLCTASAGRLQAVALPHLLWLHKLLDGLVQQQHIRDDLQGSPAGKSRRGALVPACDMHKPSISGACLPALPACQRRACSWEGNMRGGWCGWQEWAWAGQRAEWRKLNSTARL